MPEAVYAASKTIFLDELQSGMMIDQDVYSEQGMVLLPKGQVMEDIQRVKTLLVSHGVITLKVRLLEMIDTGPSQTEEAVVEEPVHERQARIFLESIDDKCHRLRQEFQRILMSGEVGQEELEDRLADTLTAFEADMNVMQLMQKVRDLDDTTYIHAHNVALTSHLIGRWMNLPEEQLKELTQTALLIDIGKMKVPAKVMKKQGKLSEEELKSAHRHAQYSYEAIKDFHFLSHQVIMGVLHHHERMDGSGYPMGLQGDTIPLYARIVAVADIYNALTSKRPYRGKNTPFEAIRIMETECYEGLDPQILYLFLNRIGNLFTGQRIVLEDDRTGEIIFIPRQNIYRPMIRLDQNQEVIDLNAAQNHQISIRDFV